VSADPAAVAAPGGKSVRNFQPVAAGDQVTVVGTLTANVVTVGPTFSATNRVLDVGAARGEDHRGDDRGDF
jgi:acyl dehydratase